MIQAAALAAVLLPLGSVAIEAEPITCGFYNAPSGCSESEFNDTQTYFFDDYKVILQFMGMTDNFSVTVNDVPMSQSDFDMRNFLEGDYDCVTVADANSVTPCRDFVFTPIYSGERPWSGYEVSFFWNEPTNETFPNGVADDGLGQVRILQAPGTSTDYSIDMCVEAANDNPLFLSCEYFPEPVPGDPGIRSGDTDFSSMTVAHKVAAVPEPSSLILIGTGVCGMLWRRRRTSL